MDTTSFESSWKSTALRLSAWGFGCGMGLAMIAVFAIWFRELPKHWSSRDLIPHHVEVVGIGHARTEGSSLEIDGIGTSFSMDLQNTTSEDVTLSKDLLVMQSDKNSGALTESSLALEKDYFIPAKHTVSVVIQNSNECNKDMKSDECFEALFKNVEAIFIFDQLTKREIRFDVPAFKKTKDGYPGLISTN